MGRRMNLYLVQRTDDCASYDISEGFVVRAYNEAQARALARVEGTGYGNGWPPEESVSCELLGTSEPYKHAEVILRDFKAG